MCLGGVGVRQEITEGRVQLPDSTVDEAVAQSGEGDLQALT